MRNFIYVLLATGMMIGGSTLYADPAVIETFDATSTCFDQDGNFLLGENSRHIVITNDGEGTVNLTIKGICPTSSESAVNFDSETFPVIIGCDAGSAGVVYYWKYHMRPDGRYTTKCSSYPLDD